MRFVKGEGGMQGGDLRVCKKGNLGVCKGGHLGVCATRLTEGMQGGVTWG